MNCGRRLRYAAKPEPKRWAEIDRVGPQDWTKTVGVMARNASFDGADRIFPNTYLILSFLFCHFM